MFGVRRQDAAMFLARHVALSQSADISAQSKYAPKRRPDPYPEDEVHTRAQPWFNRAVSIKVNKHYPTSFRHAVGRNPGFCELLMVDSGLRRNDLYNTP